MTDEGQRVKELLAEMQASAGIEAQQRDAQQQAQQPTAPIYTQESILAGMQEAAGIKPRKPEARS